MESPKDTYEKMKQIDDIEKVAYTRLFENYLKIGLKDNKKLIEIDSTNQESLLRQRFSSIPQIGMIYTFIHLNKDGIVQIINAANGKAVTFHDITPIVFCTNFNAKTGLFKGINLNMLPKPERLKFMQAYWEFFKSYLLKVEESTEYNKISLNTQYQRLALSGKNPSLFKKFNDNQNAFFEYAYRSYDLRNITKFRMLEYEEWKYIPVFDARESFKKANLDIIYNTYKDNMKKMKL